MSAHTTANCFSVISLLMLFCISLSNTNNASPTRHSKQLTSTTTPHSTKPNALFQVTKPIDLPNTLPCKQLLFQHQFGNTGGTPSVIVDYTGPHSHCTSNDFSKIVLEWSGTCTGAQAGTVFGVWLSGVELLRSSPAQPDNTSLSWKAQKDITRYSSLLLKKDTQKLAVFFRNKLDSYLVGVYHVTISISFYPADGKSGKIGLKSGMENTYWYFNHLPEFHNSNQVEDVYTNGPFRDIVIELDSVAVGAIWPYPVTYEAGSNMWNPIVSIRSFDLPTYDVELTPFLGNLLDGGNHNLSFGIGNAIDVWYVDANLHLWLDHKSQKTEAKLVANESQPLHLSSKFSMQGLNGETSIQAQRMISSEGWVKSSYGNITIQVTHNLSYTNYIHSVLDNHDAAHLTANYTDRVEQVILWNDNVSFIKDSVYDYSVMSSMKNFSLAEDIEDVFLEGEGNAVYMNNVTLGYSDVRIVYGKSSGSEFSTKSSLKDEQYARSDYVVKNFTWYNRLQDMKQSYNYAVDGKNRRGNKGDQCYFRNIRSTNGTVVHDDEGNKCV
ncbi:Peptide-N4-(N-acetyl-beta-glucosaminyl)asparagineamidase A [Linum perenne]